MIINLEKRRWLWNHRGTRGPEGGHDLHDSLPYPFETAGISDIFDNKDVLEIGPGNGRQFERVVERAKSYCIADISPDVLEDGVFSSANNRFLLEDWRQSLGRLFDVIHFWYVLHHIRLDEMQEFFTFVGNHLNSDGLVAFNCPQPINVQHAPEGDGCGTTYSDPVILWDNSGKLDMVAAHLVDLKSTWYVFLLQKRPRGSKDIAVQALEKAKERKVDQVQSDGRVVTLVHFAYTDGRRIRLGCMPNIEELHQTNYHPNYQHTNAKDATTCPACKKSAVFNT